MYVADRTGGDPQQILPPGTNKINNPVWSPDNQWIYFVSGPEPQDEMNMDVWRVRSSGGTPGTADRAARRREFPDGARIREPCCTSRARTTGRDRGCGRSMSRRRVAAPRVGRASISTRRSQPAAMAAASSPRSPIQVRRLWRVPLLDRPADERRGRTIPAADSRRDARWPRGSAARRCSISRPAGPAMDSGEWRTDRRRRSGGTSTAPCPSHRPCRRTDSASPSSSGAEEDGISRSCRRTARIGRRWRAGDRSRRCRWPGHRRLVTRRHADRRWRP